ncbi:MAG: 50S ribosomal protein L29 [Legionellaceae bacterium]|nr:50S ribosomal protein L29 [Legionellaceae bacterium]
MKVHELKKLSIEELNVKLLELRKEQFQLRLKASTGSLAKTHMVKNIRRGIARIKTLLTQKAGNDHAE